jgi:SAM-dependent methyltransferase
VTRTIGIEKATLYDQYRLPYAGETVRGLLNRIGKVKVVVDIGAGTGQLARRFAGSGRKVYAIEPDSAMRQVASAAGADSNTLEIIAGFAEHIPLADRSIDLIVVGNAFHRFRPEACGELRRILKKVGWIALITYEFTNKAFTEMLFPKLAALRGMAARVENAWRRTPPQTLFGDVLIYDLSYCQSYTEDWTAFFGAACAGIEAPGCDDEDFVAFEALNREVFEAFAVDGQIQMDYETRVSFGQPQK